MGKGKTGGRILVGNNTAVVNARLACHHISLDGQNVALCAGKRIIAGAGDSGGRTANIPLNRSYGSRGNLIRGGTDDIQAGSQHQVGGTPVGRVGIVIGVVHLSLGQVGPDVTGEG